MNSKDQALTVGKNCFAVRLRKLNRMVSRFYDDCFRPFGLTVAQFNLLVSIEARGKAKPSQLVTSLSLEKSTVSRNMEKMQKNGWVKLSAGEDRRSHYLQLTEEGKNLLSQAIPSWKEAQKKTEEAVGDLSHLLDDVSLI